MRGKKSLNFLLLDKKLELCVGGPMLWPIQRGGKSWNFFFGTRFSKSGIFFVWWPVLGGPHQKKNSLGISSLVHSRPRNCLPIAPHLARQPVNGPPQNYNLQGFFNLVGCLPSTYPFDRLILKHLVILRSILTTVGARTAIFTIILQNRYFWAWASPCCALKIKFQSMYDLRWELT